MKIFEIKTKDVYLDEENARSHPKKNIQEIKYSLKKFGQQKPIVLNSKNKVIAGNGTVMAAKELGWENIFATKSKLDDDMAIAYGLADNRTGESSAWDMNQLSKHIDYLNSIEFPVADIGFDLSMFDMESEKETKTVTFEVSDQDEFLVVLTCVTEKQQQELYSEMKERGLNCKII